MPPSDIGRNDPTLPSGNAQLPTTITRTACHSLRNSVKRSKADMPTKAAFAYFFILKCLFS
jgi:hypothetical protein